MELWPEGIPFGMALALFRLDTAAHRLVRELAEAAHLLAAGTFACFGCALMRPGIQGRGRAADAQAIPGFWLDLDLLEGDHSEGALPNLVDALEFIDALPLEPTLVLHSGGGLYLWWAFREPWTFDSAAEREEAEGLVEGWQAFLLQQATARGWRLDDTSSLTQLLRAEGTLNTKYTPPREVKRIRTDGPRWNPGDFEEWCVVDLPACRTAELPKELEPWLALAIQGLTTATRQVRRDERLHAVVLEMCPACGGTQQTQSGLAKWTAHVAPLSGALRCKRQSCEARESSERNGLEPALWVSRYLEPGIIGQVDRLRVPRPIERDHHDGRENTVTLAEADGGKLVELIDEATAFTLSGRCIALLVAPLGVGKTRAITDQLVRHRGAYFARNHALLEEVALNLQERAIPFDHVQGVGQACHFRQAYEFYGRRPDWRATACQMCPHSEDGSCRAWDTPRETIILAPHAALPHLHQNGVVDLPTGTLKRVLADRLVVIDEGANFVETLVIERERLRAPLNSPGSFGRLTECATQVSLLIDALLTRCIMCRAKDPNRGEFPTRLEGQDLIAAWAEAVSGWGQTQADSIVLAAMNVSAKSWPRPFGAHLRELKLAPEQLSHPDLLRVWRALYGSISCDASVRENLQQKHGRLEVVATDASARIEIRTPWKIPLGRKSGVLILDATGQLTRPEIQSANPNTPIREFKISVMPRPGARIRHVHLVTKSVSRRRLLKGSSLTSRGLGTLRNALREAEKFARDHCGDGIHRCGLITHMPIADMLTQNEQLRRVVTPSGLDLSPGTIGYYGKHDRGSNRFIGVRVMITIGDPVPSIGGVEADGRTLGIPAQELIDQRTSVALMQAHGRSRSIRAEGAMLHVHVGRFRPPNWNECTPAGLAPGRIPSDARSRVESVVELLLRFEEVVAVPVVGHLVVGPIPLEEGSFRTAYEALIGSSAKTPPIQAATLHRWIPEIAERLGAGRLSVPMPDAGWTVWHMPSMPTQEAVVRARRWWRILQSSLHAAEGEEVEWSV